MRMQRYMRETSTYGTDNSVWHLKKLSIYLLSIKLPRYDLIKNEIEVSSITIVD